MKMKACFWFGYDFEDLLFPSLNISTFQGFAVFCFVFVILALSLDIINFFTIYAKLLSETIKFRENKEELRSTPSEPLLESSNVRFSKRQKIVCLVLQTGLYFIEIVVGYFVMMLVMTFNAYILIMAVLCSGIVYFMFGNKTMEMHSQISAMRKTRDPVQALESIENEETENLGRACTSSSNHI